MDGEPGDRPAQHTDRGLGGFVVVFLNIGGPAVAVEDGVEVADPHARFVVLPAGQYEKSMETLKDEAKKNESKIAPVWSPDGKYIAYINSKMDQSGIYLATPDFSEEYLVTIAPVGTYLNTVAPSFSPDGKWLTFSTTDGSIWIVDIAGNGLRRLSGPGKDKFPAWSK